jgi:hypothetical protein
MTSSPVLPPPTPPAASANPPTLPTPPCWLVDDLTCELADLYLTCDTLTARLIFRGHFTGTMNGTQGHDQPITFNAIDIQHADSDARISKTGTSKTTSPFANSPGLAGPAGG